MGQITDIKEKFKELYGMDINKLNLLTYIDEQDINEVVKTL